jgi:SpoVK/Ycf46/Vps4 family AAA+-type ATPase
MYPKRESAVAGGEEAEEAAEALTATTTWVGVTAGRGVVEGEVMDRTEAYLSQSTLTPAPSETMVGSLHSDLQPLKLVRFDLYPVFSLTLTRLICVAVATFDHIGGLDDHIRSLKESVFLPLTYPEVFSQLGVEAPKGVLFHGPPGTGKTMMARALANSCSQGNRKISFFMRKGADCLSKFVGETERQLRLLFEQAQKLQPSIIFFDEIDGLAPVNPHSHTLHA